MERISCFGLGAELAVGIVRSAAIVGNRDRVVIGFGAGKITRKGDHWDNQLTVRGNPAAQDYGCEQRNIERIAGLARMRMEFASLRRNTSGSELAEEHVQRNYAKNMLAECHLVKPADVPRLLTCASGRSQWQAHRLRRAAREFPPDSATAQPCAALVAFPPCRSQLPQT